MGSFWSIFSFMCSVLSIILSVFFIPSHLDYCIVGFIPSHFTIALSVLFLLIWPLHCRFYSSSFDHCIVGSIPSHLTIALSVLFHLIWPFHCQFYSFSFDHSILSVLFLLIWPFHCRFYSFSFDHCIVSFIPSHLTIALSVFLRFTALDYPLGMFKLFFHSFLGTFQQHLYTKYKCVSLSVDTTLQLWLQITWTLLK
jgi:hypothetical protein